MWHRLASWINSVLYAARLKEARKNDDDEDHDHDNRHACMNVLHLLWNGAIHQTCHNWTYIFLHILSSSCSSVETKYWTACCNSILLVFQKPLLCCRAVIIVRSNESNERSTVAQPTSKQVSVEEQRQSTSRLLTMKRCPELASGIENPMSARIACPLVVASYSKSRSWAGGRALHGSRAGFKLVIG